MARDDDAMTSSESLVAGPGFPRMALGLGWLVSSLGTGLLGGLISGPPRALLLAAAVLGLVVTGAVVSNRYRAITLGFSALASMATIAVGLAVMVLVAITDGLDIASAAGVVPVAGGLLGLRLSRRAQRMAM
jgi:hypothetical protein